MMGVRGRPPGQMTPLRKRAQREIARRVAAGEPVLIAAVARKLGVHRQSAQRIVRDLRALKAHPI